MTADPLAGEHALAMLRNGEISVEGRLVEASNATLYCAVSLDGVSASAVYKPVAGERPLWDFPRGTLAHREVCAYLVSESTGWGIVPPTVLRDGPLGPGMCQLWIEAESPDSLVAVQVGEAPEPGWLAVVEVVLRDGRPALLVHRDDPRLGRLAVFDAVVNNADRKGGHLLPTSDGHLYGVDHGVCFSVDDKLRTLLWGFRGGPLPEEAAAVLDRLDAELAGQLGARVAELLTPEERDLTRERVGRLRSSKRYPDPADDWPPIPWPPF